MPTTAKQIHIDPEFRDLIPPLSDDEKSQLLASVLRDGCRDPLVVWLNHGTLLDGHHRFEICEANGIEFETIEKHFADKNAAMAWMIRNQFGRRNLTAMQRSELALKLKPLIEEQARERQSLAGKSSAPGRPAKKDVQKSAQVSTEKTRDEVAKLAGVSHDTISKVEKILEKAPPEKIEELRAGKTSINAVHREIKSGNAQKENPKKAGPSIPDAMNKVRHIVSAFRGESEVIRGMVAQELMSIAKGIQR